MDALTESGEGPDAGSVNRPVTAALLAALVALLSLTAVAPAGAATSRAACLKKASHAKTASARSRARAKCRKPAAKAATATIGVETVPAPAPAVAPVPAAVATVTRTPVAAPAPAPALSAIQQGLVDCANGARAQAGLPALRVDGALTRAAQAFAGDMSTRNFFDHITPEGLAPWDRIAAVLNGEAPFRTMGENIALGYADAPSTCVGWMNSAGHRANILDPDFTAIGTGWVNGYAVQDFGG